MKRKILALFMISVAISFVSCDKDDDGAYVPSEVKSTFSQLYPKAKRIDWENEGKYWVVEFRNSGRDCDAWFTSNGDWFMTQIELSYVGLPSEVRAAFETSEYGNWRVEGVDLVERPSEESVYVIEVEQRNSECNLYYSPDGTFIKVSMSDYDDENFVSRRVLKP